MDGEHFRAATTTSPALVQDPPPPRKEVKGRRWSCSTQRWAVPLLGAAATLLIHPVGLASSEKSLSIENAHGSCSLSTPHSPPPFLLLFCQGHFFLENDIGTLGVEILMRKSGHIWSLASSLCGPVAEASLGTEDSVTGASASALGRAALLWASASAGVHGGTASLRRTGCVPSGDHMR